ncbi:BTB/POZ domain-containing protein 17 [Operophtera brumata]|uniref:BTB/POZ domain-containing protein 17 n=1 Tax=Operophtera brumata TaxID=104452 RepID=A0A0L7KJR3_OPEBR|nr:BTB/POZ domain-containing protein 17 [Operophtera brumata]
MAQHIAHAAKAGHLISWMQYTMACGHNDIAKECQNFVKWNLEWVWSYCDMDELEGETLAGTWLQNQRTRLKNDNEMSEAEIKTHWDSLVAAVFSHIRFPMMCPKQLAKLLLCPLTAKHKEFFMDRMAIAMSYQSGQ